MANILTTHDQTSFDPESFLNEYYSTFNPEGDEDNDHFYKFVFKSLHEILIKGTIKGDRLLDIGTGPMCYSVYPFSKWFIEIVLSDISVCNLAVLNQWKNGKIKYGEALFSYMMKLDGNKDEWMTCNRKLSEKVSAIIQSDLHKTNPLIGTGLEDIKFDAISLPISQNAASSTMEQYEQCVRNYSKLLKQGGHIIVVDVLNEDFYEVGKHKFKVLNATKEMTQRIYEENGYHILEWREYNGEKYLKCPPFVMVARKEIA